MIRTTRISRSTGSTQNSSSVRSVRSAAALALPLILVPATLTACADKVDTDASNTIEVTQTDDACTLSSADLSTGSNTFTVTNNGSKINEFYVLTDGGRVEGEVENIGPGATRKLVVELREPGKYQGLCKPGMVGEGINTDINVTGDAVSAAEGDEALQEAVDNYVSYVRSQTKNLKTQTAEFVNAIKADDMEKAKELFPQVRTPYERIEPVAESFPNDLDPRIDLREADIADGDEWTGFHAIEKDLWKNKKITDSTKKLADQLSKDIDELIEGVESKDFDITPVQIATGAQGLLDEIATSKITGEEDIFSKTDLWDFQANLEGSKAAIAALENPLEQRKPGKLDEINKRFDEVQELLNGYRKGDGFVLYDTVSESERKKLSGALDHLTEAVSEVQTIIAG
ncbi:iron uptake system protein EfeO [Corynebacterium jeikeium]|uniref:iron uptake system protein EfeO n=1 Tax=Corynebacterium jeikeium TaxID=38289 RepID=UPI0008817FBC|nr:iron uptake system protein EfeO [Corynebacterium jeikeium]SCX17880.1 Iron uptake system component EfeO precursor [Corynebacterium jeikeium]